MTAAVPAERVAEMLGDAGYRRLQSPLQIAGLSFELAAAFVGVENSADLVVIGDTATDGQQKVVQQIEGVARALDVMRSRRSLTSIIVGPRPVGKALESLAQVSRILPVEEAADKDELRDRLAILLPLNPPQTLAGMRDLGAGEDIELPDHGVARDLYEASKFGEAAVRDRFHAALNAIFCDDAEDEEEFSS